MHFAQALQLSSLHKSSPVEHGHISYSLPTPDFVTCSAAIVSGPVHGLAIIPLDLSQSDFGALCCYGGLPA